MPSPDELAAFVAGELDPARHAWVEAWLADHPETAAVIQDDEELLQLCQATRPEEPSEAAWAAVLAWMQAALAQGADQPQPGREPRCRHIRGWRRVVVASGTAAAVLITLLLYHPQRNERPALPEPDEVLAVASPEDVEIVSIDGGDVHTLLVGQPPLREPLVLASSADVKLENIEPDVDGMMPQVRLASGPTVPMIVAPLDPDSEKNP